MGEAKRREQAKATRGSVTIELYGPEYRFSKETVEQAGSKKKAAINITTALLQAAVNLRYGASPVQPAKMDGRDARVWGRILEQLQEKPDLLVISESDFQWLWKIYSDENLQMPADLSHWRCNLEDYLSGVRDEMRKATAAA